MRALMTFSDRFKEKSTWIGLVGFLSSLGYHFTEATAETIITAGAGFCSLITILWPDTPKDILKSCIAPESNADILIPSISPHEGTTK